MQTSPKKIESVNQETQWEPQFASFENMSGYCCGILLSQCSKSEREFSENTMRHLKKCLAIVELQGVIRIDSDK